MTGTRLTGCAGGMLLAAIVAQGAVISPDAELTALVPETRDNFGFAVAIDGATLAVGAPEDDDPSPGSGFVDVFVDGGAGWAREATLVPPDAGAGDGVGYSVALRGDTLLIGSKRPVDGPNLGAVPVYERSGSTWSLVHVLRPAERVLNDGFGREVALGAGFAAVGAPSHAVGTLRTVGAVHVFELADGAWTPTARLFPPDIVEGESFGRRIAVDRDRIVVGSWTAAADASGKAWVFRRQGSRWLHEATLLPPLPSEDGGFGWSVDVRDDLILVGEAQADVVPANSGAAHVFRLVGGAWTLEQTLVVADAAGADFIGWGVALQSERALVGATQKQPPGDTSFTRRGGAVLVFERCDGSWRETDRLMLDAPVTNDFLGWSVAVADSGWVASGAPGRDSLGLVASGSTAAYRLSPLLREVSSPDAPPLLAARTPLGWHLSFEEITIAGAAYNAYEGAIGSWYSHDAVACDLPAAPDGGGRVSVERPLPAGNVYVLVSATTSCGESATGWGSASPHPRTHLDCP